MQDNLQFEVIVQEDTDTGDLLLPIPQELLDRLGWVEGDELEWSQSEDGFWMLSKLSR